MDAWGIVAGLAILTIVGSVVWIMPSKRDRRISKLRQFAITHHIKIKLMSYPVINPSGRVEEQAVSGAEYRFSLSDLLIHGPGWMVIRNMYQESANIKVLNPNWDWYVNSFPLPDIIVVHFNRLTDYCSDSLLSISLMDNVVGIGWNEEGNNDDVIFFKDWAEQLSSLLVEELQSDVIEKVSV